MKYYPGANLYRFILNNPLYRVDPTGLIQVGPVKIDQQAYCSKYRKCFQLSPFCAVPFVDQGCIGIVRATLGKGDLFDEDTECFSFPNIADTTKAANEALAAMKCGNCKYPAMFAYRYWKVSNPELGEGCPKCGRVHNPGVPSGRAGEDGYPTFDFCTLVDDGIWIGGDHGGSEPDPKVKIWPNIDTFDGSFPGVYDVTVICVTCTGKEYTIGLWPSEGPAGEQDIKCIRRQWKNYLQ